MHKIETQLEEMFGEATPDDLVVFCQQVETFLNEATIDTVYQIFADCAAKTQTTFTRTDKSIFLMGPATYYIQLGSRQTDLHLEVGTSDKDGRRSHQKDSNSNILGNGKYTKVKVRLASPFEQLRDNTAKEIAEMYSAAYNWLEAFVTNQLVQNHREAAKELYFGIKKILPPELVGQVWLYIIVDGQGCYIPDHTAQIVALKRAAKRNLITSASPLELVAEFSTTSLSLDVISAKDAIASGKTITLPFASSPYNATGFQICEEIVYNTKSHVIHPLVREGKHFLTAGYPKEVYHKVHPALESIKPRFKKILDEHNSLLNSAIKKLKSNEAGGRLVDSAVRLLGKFFQGFLDPR